MWNSSRSLKLSRALTVLFLLLLVAGLVFSMPLLRWYVAFTGKPTILITQLMTMLFSCAVPAFYALFCLHRLLRNIAQEIVFDEGNVALLRRLSWCCMAVALILLAMGYRYVLLFLLAVLAAFMGLILRVVKNVFVQAIELKLENDLTV